MEQKSEGLKGLQPKTEEPSIGDDQDDDQVFKQEVLWVWGSPLDIFSKLRRNLPN